MLLSVHKMNLQEPYLTNYYFILMSKVFVPGYVQYIFIIFISTYIIMSIFKVLRFV
jgi:hypothetical protein